MSGLAPVYYKDISEYKFTPTNLRGTAPSISSTFILSLTPLKLCFKKSDEPGKPVKLLKENVK